MQYHGSCHCGQIAFDVEGDAITQAMACNCSICSRKGSLLWFVPRERLALRTDAARMATYTFHKHVIQHHFCPTCGIHPFGEGTGPDGRTMAAVNVRCLDGVDLDTLHIEHYDGRAA
ncbi:GFA family protein [Pulveribacter sp.]|uniref:GFA family protein n=1 Tax=Pulveribacter sp. TaxID=2678893 RepID=UPI000ECBAB3D|nr:GFA family protein [Pulveribacter sp.]HCL85855.1 aldehyde-activating protein [Comamonadaceae bacterium]